MPTRKQALNGSMANQWAQSQLICFNKDQITPITVIKAESMLTNVYFQNILHVFTIYAQIYI